MKYKFTKKRPEKRLLRVLKKRAGRNNSGRITVRHKGGGVKRKYRLVEFGQTNLDIKAKVIALEYDPNRAPFLALLEYPDGSKKYILASQGLKENDEVIFSEKAPIKISNRMKLENIQIGTLVHNIELMPGQGGKLVRTAGTSAQVMGKESKYTLLKMPSTERRKVPSECFASIGEVSNSGHRFEKIGKAGLSRNKGIRPTVRGSAMNPVDHPHGGGEGRSPIGMPHPKTPWGKNAYGVKTRKKKKWTSKLIMQRRKTKR